MPHFPPAKEFEDQEKEIEKAAAEERERRKELGMGFDKAPGQILWSLCMLSDKFWDIVYIFQASDLGLVKDTLVWPSPISSCVGPPRHKSQLIRCPTRLETMFDFF